MKNHFKIAFIFLACIFLTSCAALRTPKMDKLVIGMDKAEAINALGKKPDRIIGAKKYPSGTVEIVEYTTSLASSGRPELAWLYFYKDKLVQYGIPTPDWQYDADIIAHDNNKR